jgi:hypothetical protein
MGHLESPRSPHTRTLHPYWSAVPFSRKEAGSIRSVSPSWAGRLSYYLNILACRGLTSSVQLHTLEDFTAHSNFCELALVSMGHSNVFVHVGDNVRIQAPNGRWVAPLVTGTFGSSDFLHSLLGGRFLSYR